MDINEEARELSRVPLFAKLDTSKLKLIAFTSERISLSDGEYLFSYNDPSDSVYLIVDGEIEILVERENDVVEVMVILGKNQLIGRDGRHFEFSAICINTFNR